METRAPLAESAHQRAEVLVATTWECNLRCSYCFVQQHNLTKGGERMSPKLAVRVIDALDEGLSHVESICVHLYGGEPLMNLSAIEAMLDRSSERESGRFSFAVTTNGTCLSPAVINLLDAGKFQVILSIDGPAEIHDECRRTVKGAPTHARVMDFLQALRSRTNCWVRGSAVVRSGWSLSQAEEYLRTLPVDAIKAQAVRGPDGTPYTLSETEKQAYLEDLEAIGRQVIAELEAGQKPRDDRFSSRVLQLLAGKRREAFCGAGHTTFGITPSGHVLPCVLMEQDGNLLGHVNDGPETWGQAGRRWKESRPRRTECKECSYFHLCGGGCPALMPVCGADECDLIRKNCEVAVAIFEHFQSRPEALLALAGIT
jgi:uncharacterized protein